MTVEQAGTIRGYNDRDALARLRESCVCGHERGEHFDDRGQCWDCDGCRSYRALGSPR